MAGPLHLTATIGQATPNALTIQPQPREVIAPAVYTRALGPFSGSGEEPHPRIYTVGVIAMGDGFVTLHRFELNGQAIPYTELGSVAAGGWATSDQISVPYGLGDVITAVVEIMPGATIHQVELAALLFDG